MKMISTAKHEYAGHPLKPGDEFEVEAGHVQLMKDLNRATEPARAQEYRTREMKAEQPAKRGPGRPRNVK